MSEQQPQQQQPQQQQPPPLPQQQQQQYRHPHYQQYHHQQRQQPYQQFQQSHELYQQQQHYQPRTRLQLQHQRQYHHQQRHQPQTYQPQQQRRQGLGSDRRRLSRQNPYPSDHSVPSTQLQSSMQHQQQQQQQQQQQPLESTWQSASGADPTSDVTEDPQQPGRPTDDFIPILLEETTVTCPVRNCRRSLVRHFTQAAFGFVLDVDVDSVLGKKKTDKKKNVLMKFLRMANALLNQGGGLIFIHTPPNRIGSWDEMVDDELMKLVADDTLFEENFERHVVEDHVIFRVKPRPNRQLSTTNFHSKISLNRGLSDPTHGQMRWLLTRAAPEGAGAGRGERRGVLDSVLLEDGQRVTFHENFNVQAKVVLLKTLDKKTPRNLADRGSKLAYLWWYFLKLPNFVAAFSKQQGGGSFFLGLEEEKQVSGSRWTALQNLDGLTEFLQTPMRFWADDRNTEERKVLHLAHESDVPKLENKTGHFRCRGIPLTDRDKEVLKERLKENVQNLLLLQPGRRNSRSSSSRQRSSDSDQEQDQQQAENPLVEVHFYSVRESQGATSDPEPEVGTARAEEEEERPGWNPCGGKSQGAAGDNSETSASAAAGLYVVEAKVNYYHGVCFQTETGPEAYKFDHNRRPTRTIPVPMDEWMNKLASNVRL